MGSWGLGGAKLRAMDGLLVYGQLRPQRQMFPAQRRMRPE